jgi:hypothetical protein
MIKLFAKADYRATVRSSDRAPFPHLGRQAGGQDEGKGLDEWLQPVQLNGIEK